MEIDINIINAFSINNTGGNAAGVVMNADTLTTADKQLIASKLGMSEIAFVSGSSKADFKLDFFTPVKQIAHCGHATIATFSYLKQIGQIKHHHSSKETIDGTRSIYFEGDDAFMEQRQPAYSPPSDSIHAVLNAVTLTQADIMEGLAPTIVNTGNSFLIIPVKDEHTLARLKPDFAKIEQLSLQYGLIGFYVYSASQTDKSIDATTRMFAPLYGIEEESATGMAAGPLACFLYDNGIKKTNMNIGQGKFMHPPSPSLIKVNLTIEAGKIVNLFAGGSSFLLSKKSIEI